MDILEQFIRSISYKFSKGYPDFSNNGDLLILENELKELGIDLEELELTKHYLERKNERKYILNISNLTQEMIGDRDFQETKSQIIDTIEQELDTRLSNLENIRNIPLSFQEIVVYKILKPILYVDGKKYDLKTTTQSSKNDKVVSSNSLYYVAVIKENKIITYMGSSQDDLGLEQQVLTHEKIIDEPTKSVKILTADNFEYLIPLDKQTPEKTSIDPNSLPYKVKKSYRVGSEFIHKEYGTGKVVAASVSGTRAGEPDSRGIVEWVEVDFGKPYVSNKQFKTTRIIKNVYTSLSPALSE